MKRQNLDRARGLRQTQTDAGRQLCYHLRNRQLAGHKFRRRHEVDHYIVDFVCIDAKLVVEPDRGQHTEQRACDDKRTRYLEARGCRVLRFWNNEALTRIESVLEVILASPAGPAPHPNPLPAGEREHIPES